MKITDRIRASACDHEIRFLLSSYLEKAHHDGELNGPLRAISDKPLNGLADVNRRFAALLVELDTASKRLDDRRCLQIKEALQILATASDRLQWLAAEHQRAAAQTHRHPA